MNQILPNEDRIARARMDNIERLFSELRLEISMGIVKGEFEYLGYEFYVKNSNGRLIKSRFESRPA